MEKNKKSDFTLDFDNLKGHLNASFDEDNINVSEELITKTLTAVKENKLLEKKIPDEVKHKNVDGKKEENKKRYKVAFTKLIGTAAAVLVLFLGLNVMNSSIGKNNSTKTLSGTASDATNTTASLHESKKVQKDIINEAADNSTSVNTGATESSEQKENINLTDDLNSTAINDNALDGKDAAEEPITARKKATEDTVTTGNGKADQDIKTSEKRDTEIADADKSDTVKAEVAERKTSSTSEPEDPAGTEDNDSFTRTQEEESQALYTLITNSFSDVYTVTSADITSYSITNINQKEKYETKDNSKFTKLLTILNQYPLTAGTNNISSNSKYQIEITTKDTFLYTVLAGDDIQVRRQSTNKTSDEFYSVYQTDELMKELDKLFNSLKESSK
jgi:hypothetical protein